MPKITNNEEKNPIQCSICNEYRFFEIRKTQHSGKNRGISLNEPFFYCKKCAKSESLLSDKTIEEQIAKVQNGKTAYLKSALEEKKFEPYNKFGFKYDPLDYYYIPGLIRPWNEGFLTPVFFSIELLFYYNSNPDYWISRSSFSSLQIYDKNGQYFFDRGFGINRNGNLFAWLGDLYEFFEDGTQNQHLKRFLLDNINSDHDIISDYYFNNIEANFTKSDNENEILHLKNKFEENIYKKYIIKLSTLNIKSLRDRYAHPLVNDKNLIFNAYSKLNKILIENLNKEELKKALKNKGVDSSELKNLGSLKLFEKFVEKFLDCNDSHNLMTPFFVLYDLRILNDHLMETNFEVEYNDCKKRIGISNGINYYDFYKIVLQSLIKTYEKLNELVDSEAGPDPNA